MTVHSTAVANRFLQLANSKGIPLTQMQLQKLVYIAHGWSLAILGRPLTSDAPHAWDYGPVYPDLWGALKGYGRAPVSRPIRVRDRDFGVFAPNPDDAVIGDFDSDVEELMSVVFDNYGHFHAFQLSALTHEPGTPWHQVYVGNRQIRGLIENQKIRDHFVEIARERAAA